MSTDLRTRIADIERRAEAKVKEITADTTEERAAEIEREFDELIDHRNKLQGQMLSQNLRESTERPMHPDVRHAPDGSAAALERAAFKLTPEQRMLDWAESRAPDPYGGLTPGAYLRAMVTGGKDEVERRALAEGSDSAGGYTVPTMLSAQLIDNLRAASVVSRAGARTVPLTSDSHSIAAIASDPVPTWRSENAAVAESDPTFRNVPLTPRSLSVLVRVSRELIEDSLNLETELPRLLSAALATELDRVALLGSGTPPEPRGIASTVGIGTTALGGGLVAYSPLVTARTGILSANAGAVSAIIMHPRDEGTLVGLTASDGQPLMAPEALRMIPMLTTTAIPTDGGAGSNESTIIEGNFSHLLIGMRAQIRVEILRERFSDNLQYGFLAHLRADVAVEHAGAFHTITGITP
tara:strand:+ start:210 stop:1442 length:1233 start_codon:yes stop_codon:yes gene_type:complete